MGKKFNLSIDLGASNVRIILNKLENNELHQKTLTRFPTHQIKRENEIYWDYKKIFQDILIGLERVDVNVESIGIDGWGVDFAYIDQQGKILDKVIAYRDYRTEHVWKTNKKFNKKMAFQNTGIHNDFINSIYQINRDLVIRKNIVSQARYILNIADLFNYLMTGEIFNEYSIIKTTELINRKKFEFDKEIAKCLNIEHIQLKPIYACEKILAFKKNLIKNINFLNKKLVVVASHDTASALVPAMLTKTEIFIALGTWSVMGVIIDNPLIDKLVEKNGFSNEGSFDGKIKFIKNINGLYLIQELQKSFDNKYTFSKISELASKSKCEYIFDPNDLEIMNEQRPFLERINNYFVRQNKNPLKLVGDFAKSIYLSLINEYKKAIILIEKIVDIKVTKIKLYGGGLNDKYFVDLIHKNIMNVNNLLQESSSIGNALLQFKAMDPSIDIKNIKIFN